MHEFLHLTNPLPDQIPPFSSDGYLFLQARHLRQQPCRPLHYFAWRNTQTGNVDAHCPLFVRDDWAVSPCAASFGSVEFREELPAEALQHLLVQIIERCRQLPVRGIRLVNYPHCYAPAQTQRLHDALLSVGFRVHYEELNQHVPVTEQPFGDRLYPAESRRLRKSHRAGFAAGIWSDPDPQSLFELVRQARTRKSLPLTMQPEALANLLNSFPDDCRVFTVRDGVELIAACIGIRVRSDILYYFLPADHADYQMFSPSVMLIEQLYQYCQQHRIRLLDLGISTSRGIRNEGLIRFKRQLGAQESPKWVFELAF